MRAHRPSRHAAKAALLALAAACAGRARPVATPRPTVPPADAAAPAPAAPATTGSGGALTEADLAYLGNRGLAMPVAGVRAARVPSSFTEARSGGRVHEAADILAPRGTPVLAADEGRVWKLRTNALGGLTVYATDPLERFVYYYAHLDRYHPGLFEGQPLFRGDTIGYVGTTGNAPPGTPHLHFQITRVARDGQWWGGTPVDPVPVLRAAEQAREVAAAAAGAAGGGPVARLAVSRGARGPERAVGAGGAERVVHPAADSTQPPVPR